MNPPEHVTGYLVYRAITAISPDLRLLSMNRQNLVIVRTL
ncbi:hypothetical protein HD600_001503 [Microbacterium ginsengiterrae]|uniref:Uncharacterized protein n=1 Tax=Microbacterium ginsengiterrae TaxID=546115 RepID=A0A7W9FB77_9MICO|nr:hypothetical protein [Microbacterium ginsengiterrae]